LGAAGLMSAMLDEGTENYDALEFAARAEELGAVISSGSSLDTSSIGLSALSVNLEDSLELLKEAILNPSFDESELERVRSNWLDQIAREKTEPYSLALRNLPPLLYGDNHPYGIPFTGSGTEESISALTADQLRAFHRTWIRPDNAQIVVVGNLSREEIEPLLNNEFGDWDAPDIERPAKELFPVDPVEETVIYLMDKPGSPQSLVIGGHLLPPNQDEDREELDMAVRILGGNFNARLNMNLREDKGWAYGARASATSAVGQRPLIYYAPVQIDRTVDSLRELIRETNAYIGETPANIEELTRSKDGILRSLPGRYETNGSVAGTLQDILMYDRPLDYVDRYQNELESMTLEDVQQAANAYLMPGNTIWLIVGDLDEIEQPLREAGIADVRVIEN